VKRIQAVLRLVTIVVLSGCAHTALTRGPEREDLSGEQLVQVAQAAEQMGDTLRAQQYLGAALRAGAEESRVLPKLLLLYVSDGQYRVAIEHCEHYLRRHPNDQKVRLLLSTLHTAVGDHEGAITQYERVLSAAPGDAYAHFALASVLHEQGGSSLRADEHFRTYLELAPDGEHAAEARGLLLKRVP
jgi:tetratricopeptide (TPR) repeat protein